MNHEYGVLEQLTRIIGPSCYEKAVQAKFGELMKPLVDHVFSDSIGNCYAQIKGERNLPKIMMTAHADSVGFMVSHIDSKGFVFTRDITQYACFDYRNLPQSEVRILSRNTGKSIAGFFLPTVPVHFLSDDDLAVSIDRTELAIDIGSKSAEQTRRYVDMGDYVVLEPHLKYLSLNGNKTHLVASNLDDRVGLYCLYRIAKSIKQSRMKFKAPVTFVSTITEEGGTGAAGVAGNLIQPQASITIDGTPASDQIRENNEDTIAKVYGTVGLGLGPVLPRGLTIDDDVFIFLEKICKGKMGMEGQMPYQIEVGKPATENEYLYISGKRGVKSAAVYIPMRSTHTSIETVCLDDVKSTIKLCTEFYKKVSKGRFP